MGQIISSEYIELYQNPKILPKPKHHEYLSVNDLKQLKIFTLKEIQTDFNGVEADTFQQHENKHGFYYGRMQGNQRQGLGIQYYNKNNEDIVYLGQFRNDTIQGEGLLLMSDNSLFIGHWNEQKSIDGDNGLYYTKEGDLYCGLWQDRKISFGYQKKLIYEYFGEFQNGLRHGYGKCIGIDGTIYEGQWGNDEMHGKGIQTLYNGVNFVGNFLSSIKQGDGILNTKFEEYLGAFHLDQFHGLGQLMDIHTKRIQEGKWEYGELKGLYCEHTNDEQQKNWFYKSDDGTQPLQLIKNNDSIIKLYELDDQIHGFGTKRLNLHNMKQEIQNKMKEILPKCIKYQQLSQNQLNRIKSWQSLIQFQQFNEKQ